MAEGALEAAESDDEMARALEADMEGGDADGADPPAALAAEPGAAPRAAPVAAPAAPPAAEPGAVRPPGVLALWRVLFSRKTAP